MARITTPFDDFVDELSAWIYSAWFVWVGLAVALAIIVVIVTVTKARARARAREPQYRRHES